MGNAPSMGPQNRAQVLQLAGINAKMFKATHQRSKMFEPGAGFFK